MANDGPLKLMYLSPVGTPDFDGNHISECPRAPRERDSRGYPELHWRHWPLGGLWSNK